MTDDNEEEKGVLKRKVVSGTMLALLITISMLALAFDIQPIKAEPHTKVYVDPPVNSAQPGQNFTININIANVTDLRCWGFSLYFAPLVLSTDESMIKEGPFLSQNDTYLTAFTIRKELIYWHVSCCLIEPGSVDGNGTLASITFKVLREGQSNIALIETQLRNPDIYPIDHTSHSGYFRYQIIPGDVNGDGIVSITDLVIVALAFGSSVGEPNIVGGPYNPDADLNNDGKVNIVDLVIIGVNFGKRL